MNVYLVGFMGSGKSSLGKKLAKRLERDFIDLDEIIEKSEGKSISDIFQEKGEEYFRELEQKVLFSLGSSQNAVVSLGGGACCNNLSWSFLDQNGLIIYLKEPVDVLYGRLKKNKSNRPLIVNMEDAELRSFVENKLNERSAFYDKAHFTYEKDKTTFSFLVNQIQGFTSD